MAVTTEQIKKNMLFVWGLSKFANPKMRKYCKWKESGVVFLDEKIVSSQLDVANKKISKYVSSKKNILLVTQQSLYSNEVVEIAKKNNVFYMKTKVPAWFLTNFETLIKSVKKMNEIQKFVQSDKFVKLSKKEQSSMKRDLLKMEKIYLWVSWLTAIPDLVVVVNWTLMNWVVREIEQVWIDSIILASSDFDKRRKEDSIVMLNTNSYTSVMFALQSIFWK